MRCKSATLTPTAEMGTAEWAVRKRMVNARVGSGMVVWRGGGEQGRCSGVEYNKIIYSLRKDK